MEVTGGALVVAGTGAEALAAEAADVVTPLTSADFLADLGTEA